MRRVLLALMLVSGIANAETIVTDGDYHTELRVLEDGLTMTGGRVDTLILWGDGPYNLQGGSVGRVQLESGDVVLSGGQVDLLERSERFGGGSTTTITFQGPYFRVQHPGQRDHNSYQIEGYLSDLSFLQTRVVNSVEFRTVQLPTIFEIIPDLPRPTGDVTGTFGVDLEDLNEIRNEFGIVYDLEDLNVTRNEFGINTFTLPESLEITQTTTVPEPSTMWLGLLSLALFIGRVVLRGT